MPVGIPRQLNNKLAYSQATIYSINNVFIAFVRGG